tara:strand:- start:2822 stop:3334 length:513 start_codon:yes stop_codon:yes gene_type:complete
MSLVVAIDVGIKNLAICAYDFVTSRVVHWDNVSLVPSGRYIPAQNVQYVRDFVQRHNQLFSQASTVIVERQMRCNMRIIEAVLQCMFFERCVVINARCVKMHYGLSTRNYRANKAKAVEWATAFVQNNDSCFAPHVADIYARGKKQDDLADALLLVMYYLDTYSNQMSSS